MIIERIHVYIYIHFSYRYALLGIAGHGQASLGQRNACAPFRASPWELYVSSEGPKWSNNCYKFSLVGYMYIERDMYALR